MAKLLMISGDTALAEGKRGAFYNTLEEFHKYWEIIDIICPRTGNRRLETKNYFDNVFIHPSPWPKIFQPFWILKKGKDIFKKERFDVVTVHEYPPFYNGIGARLLWNKIHVPYVLEIMHIPGLPRSANVKERTYKILSKIFIRFTVERAAKVRVINQNQVPKFLQSSGVPVDKLIYIPAFYIDLDIFKPQPDAVKKYDLIFIGRLEKNKGINLFLEAVRKSGLKGIIVGDGSLKKDTQSKIDRWKLEIDMHGWAKDSQEIADLLNGSKILAMPSYNEGGPRVILEAMACGVPVLATPVGIVPDVINNKNEIVNWDSEDIACKAKKLLSNKALYEKSRQEGLTISQRFERSSEIKNYADKLKSLVSNSKRKLLIVTQKVDENDQLLGFFIAWLNKFSEHFDKILILCLEKGKYALPDNVEVISMGKDRGLSKLSQFFNFYRLIFSRREDYQNVFVHMNPIWVVLGGLPWHLLNKKIFLWYTHGKVTAKLKLAEIFSDRIFTASKESFRLPSRKVIVTGHGIDTELFKPDAAKKIHDGKLRILSVGRIAPIKNYGILINAAKILKNEGVDFLITVLGESTLNADKLYETELKKRIKELDLEKNFAFKGKVGHQDLAAYYQANDLFVHLSKTGSLDKVLLEAMACGITVLSCNESSGSFLPKEYLFNEADPEELIERVKFAELHPKNLREYVAERHNLSDLVTKLSNYLS